MAKNGFNKLHLFWIIPLGLVLIIGVLFFFKGINCTEENKHITTGTQYSNGKCCEGLIGKSPRGFTGGAWCVKPYCEVICLSGLEETQGVTVEGIYSICSSQTDTSVTLLKPSACFREDQPRTPSEECNLKGGKWVDVSEIQNNEIDLEIKRAEECRFYGGNCWTSGERPISVTIIGKCEAGICLHPDFQEDTCLIPK